MADPHDALKTPPVAPSPAGNKPSDLTGSTVGRFRIENRLGSGGMGQVFRAQDTTLKRVVAIKRMSPQLQNDQDRQRFLKEAQRASALNHPNVAAIYDVLEHEGEILLVMEYIEGTTLRRRIITQPCSLAEFLPIAIQCAEGLDAAHQQRIIHGDIKPENIMLTAANRVKILDFGVARRFTTSDPLEATQSVGTISQSISGTLAYMAPEVLQQKPLDGRADLFSLGLVFYEMLGGKQPFLTDSFAGTLGRVLHTEPPPLSEVNRTLPPSVADLVTKLLKKDPAARYPSASALATDLQTVQQGGKLHLAAPPVPEPPKSARRKIVLPVVAGLAILALLVSYQPLRHALQNRTKAESTAPVLPKEQVLAVLPFAPMELDPKLTALGQGLVESVAAKLGRLTEQHSLEVIPARNMQEKGIASLEDARKQFGANLGLKVTLRQSAELIRVSYSLTDAQSGRTLGGDSITVPAADVFAVEDSVAAGAVKALQLQLRPEEEAALKGHGTSQAAAYNYFLQARGYLLNYSRPENVQNATTMLHEALKLDANFGAAKAALGETYWRKYWLTKEKQWTVQARNECEQAVTLGNAGAAGHSCLGLIYDGTGKYEQAVAEYQRAIELDASDENAYLGLALALEHQGAIDKAEQTLRSTVGAHPKSWIAYNALGLFYNRRNQFDKAVEMLQKVTELAPEGYAAYVNLGAIYVNMGRNADAIPVLNKSLVIRPTYAANVNLGTAYFGMHRFHEAVAAYEQATRLDPKQYVTWGNLGEANYYAGSKTQALPAYRKAAVMAVEELKVNPHDTDLLSDLANYHSMLGERDQALNYLEQALRYGRNDKDVLLKASLVHNQLGETGLALEWLTKALQQGYSATKVRDLPAFDNLASNSRYQELVGNAQASR